MAPDPALWAGYQRDIYASLRPPAFTTDPGRWEALARDAVPAANFDYVAGNAGQGRTCASNIDAFARYRIRPRMLVNATRRDCAVELFGRRLPSPVLVAPIGVQGIMHRDAEEATARACRALQVPMILSTAATRSLEQVADANGEDGDRWFQVREASLIIPGGSDGDP
jgi:lactate 2-monooxygenase